MSVTKWVLVAIPVVPLLENISCAEFLLETTVWLLKNCMGKNGICCSDFTFATSVFKKAQNS